ncbi:MAG: dihydrofolate reductase family protein [Candidatus Thiodiazotropha sp. (ex Monitilora ramsayi)]|nr:dihydrofolate reductase family protein [Candidatus Thiodiazotropha sp. (ex Monitilora ramsayi)]
MKITYYVASSLDGFIAKEGGDVSWLDELGVSMSDTGYEGFYSTVDALVMGRKTYEFVVNYGQWPYGDKPVWVCSSRKILPMEGCNLQEGSTPEDVYKTATEMNIKHLWCVGGGELASSFMEAKLLTNIYLSLMPVLLGSGIKLFGNLPSDVMLNKVREKSYASGMVQLEYAIK